MARAARRLSGPRRSRRRRRPRPAPPALGCARVGQLQQPPRNHSRQFCERFASKRNRLFLRAQTQRALSNSRTRSLQQRNAKRARKHSTHTAHTALASLPPPSRSSACAQFAPSRIQPAAAFCAPRQLCTYVRLAHAVDGREPSSSSGLASRRRRTTRLRRAFDSPASRGAAVAPRTNASASRRPTARRRRRMQDAWRRRRKKSFKNSLERATDWPRAPLALHTRSGRR